MKVEHRGIEVDKDARLTPREQQVLVLIAHDNKRRKIARLMDISEYTVRFYITRLSLKSGCDTQAGMVSWGYRNGYLQIPGALNPQAA